MEKADVRNIRHYLGWSQESLAEQMGVTIRTLQRWERSGRLPETASKLLDRVRKEEEER